MGKNDNSDNKKLEHVVEHVTRYLTSKETAALQSTNKSIRNEIITSDVARLNMTIPIQEINDEIGPKVRSLSVDIERSYLSDINIAKAISKCPNLESLNAFGSDFGNKSLLATSPLEFLSDLDISACINITPEGIKQLETMNRLRNLNISHLTKIDIETIKYLLARTPHLENLSMIGTGNTANQLSSNNNIDALLLNDISKLSRLETLDVRDKVIGSFQALLEFATQTPRLKNLEFTTQESVTQEQKEDLDTIIAKKSKELESKESAGVKRKTTSSPSPISAQRSKKTKMEERGPGQT